LIKLIVEVVDKYKKPKHACFFLYISCWSV